MGLFDKIFGGSVKATETVDREKQYAQFWEWFILHEKKFKENIDTQNDVLNNVIEIIDPKLKALNEFFFPLVGKADDDVTEFIVTPDGILKTVALIDDFIASAPKLEGWRFLSCKRAHSGISLVMHGFTLSEETVSFIPIVRNGCPDYIHLNFIIDAYTPEYEKELRTAMFMFLDNYIGEYQMMTMMDELDICAPGDIIGEPIPVSKLSEYLNFREAEFIERYNGVKRESDLDNYVIMKYSQGEEEVLVTLNKTFLLWEERMSYPWVVRVDFEYTVENVSGMPIEQDLAIMGEIEELILETGQFLIVARETGTGERNLYLAVKEFRAPSKAILDILSLYNDRIVVNYYIYRDKYWIGLDMYRDTLLNG